jgi:hypothetical protein
VGKSENKLARTSARLLVRGRITKAEDEHQESECHMSQEVTSDSALLLNFRRVHAKLVWI